MPAELALAVVDDTVISFADDKTGHMLSKLLLEPEIPGGIEEPNFYFDLTEDKSALGMELLMGTRGWRRFEWAPVLSPPPPVSTASVPTGAAAGGDAPMDDRVMAMPAQEPPAAVRPAPADKQKRRAERERVANAEMAADRDDPVEEEPNWAGKPDMADRMMDEDLERRPARTPAPLAFAPVRVFPAPDYSGPQAGARTDFRETIHWAPSVKTDRYGKATITLYTSDAVTSFRVFAEGVGGGLAGRHEQVFKSNLPFSMNVKLPLEVSAGDVMELPLTLTNEQGAPLPMSLAASFGDLLTLSRPVSLPGPALPANARQALFYEVEVSGMQGQSEVKFSANAGGLTDEFVRSVRVQPLGFPQTISRSGTLTKALRETVDLAGATQGTIEASLKLYPSPVSTLVSGLEGLLR